MRLAGPAFDIAPPPTSDATAVLVLDSAQQAPHILSLERHIATPQWQSSFQDQDHQASARLPAVRHEPDVARQRLTVLRAQQAQLKMLAPFSGTLMDVATPLIEGQWLPAGEWLATVTGAHGVQVEAFVSEQDLTRLTVGDGAARLDADRIPVPEQAIYRVLLSHDGASPTRVIRGTVSIKGSARSPLLQAWRNVLAILIRESAL